MKKTMKAIAAVMLSMAMVFAVGCKPDEEENNNENNGGGNDGGDEVALTISGNYNSHNYVDLGLPSGNLWATCNIGAEDPEGLGAYIAWGETQPKDTTYYWDTYQYSATNDFHGLTKYCCNAEFGFNGFYDGLKVLLDEDDAAKASWGGDWRIPSYSDWEELVNNCTSEWVTIKDVKGKLFTATNGNTFFLPAAGRISYMVDAVGVYGHYWMNELTEEGVTVAKEFCVSSSDNSLIGDYRCYGQSVRPVYTSR